MKPKEPLVALLLSVIFTGLGQIYAGRTRKGLVLLCISVTIPILASTYFLHPATKVYFYHLLLIPLAIGFALFVLFDAYKSAKARNVEHNVERKITRWKRILLIVGILFLIFVFNPSELLVLSMTHYVRTNVAQAFKVPVDSMRPTLIKGDRVLVDKAIYKRSEPQRGDLIVFKYPLAPEKTFLKRLIGLPGDTVEIKDGHLMINGSFLQAAGHWVALPYYNHGDYGQRGQTIQVLPDHYYVLGDNSAASADSRVWGFVPKQNLIGKAYKVYWPPDRSGRLE